MAYLATLNMTSPNPDTYLNHLPPAEASRFEITRDIYLTILGAAVWDILVYIPEDIRILFSNLGIVTLCFVFSRVDAAKRVFAVAYVLLFVIVQTHPIANCDAMLIAMGLVCFLAMASTSFLFLRRLQAVYADNRIVRWIFCFLWLATTANTITVVVGVHAERIEGTGYCAVYDIKSYAAVAEFCPAVFDTFVFFAITYRLVSSHGAHESGTSNWSKLITGKSLPRLSRALLQGGQQYYTVVFGMTIASGVVLYSPSIPLIYRPMLTLMSTTLTASMACRVFRNLKMLECDYVSSTLIIDSGLDFARDAASRRSTQLVSENQGRPSFSVVLSGNSDLRAVKSSDLQMATTRQSQIV